MTDTNQTLDRSYLDDMKPLLQGSRKPRPVPGAYYVQFPQVIEVTTPIVGGKLLVEAALGGTTITRAANGDETFRGEELQRFLRVNTKVKKVKEGGNYTDLDDLLETQGIDVRTLNTPEDYTNAINTHIAGQESAIPLYLTYNGDYKKADGKTKVWLKSKDFTRADGSHAKVTYVLDESTGLTATDPTVPDEVVGNEQAKRDFLKQYKVVYANLEPGFRGYAKMHKDGE